MTDNKSDARYVEIAAGIVCAYVQNNSIPATELAGFLTSVHSALIATVAGSAPAAVEAPREPAVSVRKSVTPDYLICLEDGRKLKSLKRHLTTMGLTPQSYRAKWGLPADYPMVAPNYAKARSDLAKAIGLGRGGRAPETAPQAANESAPKAGLAVAARSSAPGRVKRSPKVA